MIDAGPSRRAAEGLKGSAVAAYVSRTGWDGRPSRVDGISIFSKVLPGFDVPIEFILPVVPGFDEEQWRIADALRTLQGVERRPLEMIADDIRKMSGESRPAYQAPGFAEDE